MKRLFLGLIGTLFVLTVVSGSAPAVTGAVAWAGGASTDWNDANNWLVVDYDSLVNFGLEVPNSEPNRVPVNDPNVPRTDQSYIYNGASVTLSSNLSASPIGMVTVGGPKVTDSSAVTMPYGASTLNIVTGGTFTGNTVTGDANAAGLIVGSYFGGTLNMSGGLVNLSKTGANMVVGSARNADGNMAAGVLNISGGSIWAANTFRTSWGISYVTDANVGQTARSTVNQTGGTVSAYETILIGYRDGTAVYNLSGSGVLMNTNPTTNRPTDLQIGTEGSNATFNQSGGLVYLQRGLYLGRASDATYNLSAGSISMNNVAVGTNKAFDFGYTTEDTHSSKVLFNMTGGSMTSGAVATEGFMSRGNKPAHSPTSVFTMSDGYVSLMNKAATGKTFILCQANAGGSFTPSATLELTGGFFETAGSLSMEPGTGGAWAKLKVGRNATVRLGGLTMSSVGNATLSTEIASASSYSRISLLGGTVGTTNSALNLSGGTVGTRRLDVQVLSGFVPYSSETYGIMTSVASLTGSFTSITSNLDAMAVGNYKLEPNSGSAFALTGGLVGTNYNLTSNIYARYGDVNRDHAVDISDLTILGTNWNTAGSGWATGDFNADGTVDISDLTILGTNWNAAMPAPPMEGIPEPATMALLGLGGLALVRRKHLSR